MGNIMWQEITPQKTKLFRIPWARWLVVQNTEARQERIFQRSKLWTTSFKAGGLTEQGLTCQLGLWVPGLQWDPTLSILTGITKISYNEGVIVIPRVFNPFELVAFVSASQHTFSTTCEAILTFKFYSNLGLYSLGHIESSPCCQVRTHFPALKTS